MEELEISHGEDPTGRVDFLEAYSPNFVRRNRNNTHAVSNLFAWNDMKDMVKVSVDVMKPVAHGHVF